MKSLWEQGLYIFHDTTGASCIICCTLLTGLVADDSLFSMLHVLLSYTVEYEALISPMKNFSGLLANMEIRLPDDQSSLSQLQPTDVDLLPAGCQALYRVLGKQKALATALIKITGLQHEDKTWEKPLAPNTNELVLLLMTEL